MELRDITNEDAVVLVLDRVANLPLFRELILSDISLEKHGALGLTCSLGAGLKPLLQIPTLFELDLDCIGLESDVEAANKFWPAQKTMKRLSLTFPEVPMRTSCCAAELTSSQCRASCR